MIENWKYNNIELNSIEEIKLHEPKPWGFVYLLTLYDLKTIFDSISATNSGLSLIKLTTLSIP